MKKFLKLVKLAFSLT